MPRPVSVTYRIWPTATEAAAGAAELFASSAAAAVAARGVARIAVSGGNTPKAMFSLLADASQPYFARVPWANLHIFWVDERCVPPSHAESNYRMTKEAMLEHVPLPPAQIYRIEAELKPQVAASRYEAALRTAFQLQGGETPVFDLVLLGLGEDGHTASLFPHTEAVYEMVRLVMANHVPQKETWRITLTWPVINCGRAVAFLIEGKEKAQVVADVFLGAYDPEAKPSQLIRPASGRLTLLLDADAAANLPAQAPEADTAVLSNSEPQASSARNDQLVFSDVRSKRANFLQSYGREVGETENTSRLELSATEILAAGLIGLVVALLFSVRSLPVYRAHVSLNLPSASAGVTIPSANGSGSRSAASRPVSPDQSLLDGELTGKVAERLLAAPHPSSVFRQDVLSRGMRDLHLGGREAIPYANLVAETAHSVKVRHLESQNLYEVTCDSWSSQFAATFCNEFTDVLDEEASDAMFSQHATEYARSIDPAADRGTPVYPHWYRQSLVGFAVGCLIGILLGLVKTLKASSESKDVTV